ncbi:MAG: DUF2783 domain-containing protein [Sphingomonadaceae bacterium]|nr:DUF2783 domain-containing protein [Sphingomonadaceae bacterium]
MLLEEWPALCKPDDVYERLLRCHQGLTDEESAAFNVRLILILLSHIQNEAVVDDALMLASTSGDNAKKQSETMV